MSRTVGHKMAVCALLVSFMQTSLLAQTGAIIYPGAGTKVNGRALQTSSAVLSGDHVQTATLPAQLTASGTTVQVGSSTELIYGPTLELVCGSVDVNTVKQLSLHASDIELEPTSAESTRYQVKQTGSTIHVTAQLGRLVVREHGQTSTLEAGQWLSRPSSLDCSPVSDAAPSAAAKPHLPLRTLGIIGAAGAAGLAAAVYRDNGNGSVSPSRP